MSFLLFEGCSEKEAAQKPAVSTDFDQKVEREMSHINLPIVFEVKELENKVNSSLKGTLYKDESFEDHGGDKMKIEVSKTSDIQIKAYGNILTFKLPLKIQAEGLFEKHLLKKINIKKTPKIELSPVIYIQSALEVTDGWKLKTDSKLLRVEWSEEPMIKVLGLDLHLKKTIEKILHAKKEFLMKKMDQAITDHADIAKIMVKAWGDLHKPIRINKKHKGAWMTIDPQGIEVSNLMSNGKTIYLYAGLDAFINIALADESPSVNQISPLPPHKTKHTLSDDFELNILSVLPYVEINNILKSALTEKKLELAGNVVKLQKAEIYGNGKNVAVGLEVAGDYEGKVYLQGRPVFDAASAVLSISNFAFDLNTKETLFSTADWLFHDDVIEAVQDRLSIKLGEHIEKIPAMIMNSVDKGKIGEKLDLKLKDLQLFPRQISVTKDNIYILTNVKGKVGVVLEKF